MCSCARIGLPAATRPTSGSVKLGQARQRQAELLAARLVKSAQRVGTQPDAARGAAHQLDHALARQRLQVLLGRVGRAKAELGGDLGARGRRAGALDGALHEFEDLLLAVGKLGAFFDHGRFQAETWWFVQCTVFSSRSRAQCNAKS